MNIKKRSDCFFGLHNDFHAIPMDDLVDKAAERARLTKELEVAEKALAQCENKLNNAGFMAKAPENVVEGVRQNAAAQKEKIALIRESLQALA